MRRGQTARALSGQALRVSRDAGGAASPRCWRASPSGWPPRPCLYAAAVSRRLYRARDCACAGAAALSRQAATRVGAR